MKGPVYKADIEKLIFEELQVVYPNLPIESVGLVILPEQDWGVVIVSNGEPATGHVLAVGVRIAQSLQEHYEIVP